MFPIDADDPTPLYLQLERSIRLAIATGRLGGGDRLPTVRQLAVELKVNANTVARAFAALERAGVLHTRRGAGTFVAARPGGLGPRPGRERQLAELGARYLADAAALGVSADEAMQAIRELILEAENDHAGRQGRGG